MERRKRAYLDGLQVSVGDLVAEHLAVDHSDECVAELVLGMVGERERIRP